jgi:streptogramin lyase
VRQRSLVATVLLGTLMISGALWLFGGQSQLVYAEHLPTHPPEPQPSPSATVKVWDTGAPIGGISLGATPGESIEDPTGLTGHGTTSPTVVTVYARSSHPQGLSGVSYWNPDTNVFVWYGKTMANPLGDVAPFPGGVDVNQGAPVRTGPSPLFGTVTFGPGDVWVGGLQIQQPLYMHFAGTNRFRTYGVNSVTDRSANRIWGVKLDQTTGNVFVAVPDLGEIARLNPVTAEVTAWVVGGTNVGPAGLTLDSSGRPFTTLSQLDIVLRVDRGADGVLGTADDIATFWRVPNRGGIRSFRNVPPAVPVLLEEYPNAIITTDADGNVWFTQSNSNEIGRLSAGPDGVLGSADDVICEYTKPGLLNPQQIASTGSGDLLQVYFTEGEGNSVSVLTQAEADAAGAPTRVCTPVAAETVPVPPDQGITPFFEEEITPLRTTIIPTVHQVPGLNGGASGNTTTADGQPIPPILRFSPMPNPALSINGMPIGDLGNGFPSGMTGVYAANRIAGAYLKGNKHFELRSGAVIAPPSNDPHQGP